MATANEAALVVEWPLESIEARVSTELLARMVGGTTPAAPIPKSNELRAAEAVREIVSFFGICRVREKRTEGIGRGKDGGGREGHA